MSNERVVRAAEAVNDLQAALEIWCDGTVSEEPLLITRGAANDAVVAIDQALAELYAIRDETVNQARAYDDAASARLDALLAVKRPASAYTCGDCGQVFPIDPADPMESHGAYLDHMDDHERADAVTEAEDDVRDKASEAAR